MRSAGRPSGDWDLATRATPAQTRRESSGARCPIRVDHGTIGVLARDGTLMYEVTTFRRDVETTGRHAVVEFADRAGGGPGASGLHDQCGGLAPDPTTSCTTHSAARPISSAGSCGRWVRRRTAFRRGLPPSAESAAVRGGLYGNSGSQAETWTGPRQRPCHRVRALSPERVREELEKVLDLADTSPSRVLGALRGFRSFSRTLYPELDADDDRGSTRAGGRGLVQPRASGQWTCILAGPARAQVGGAPARVG
jgi:hypothetical protein